MKQAETLKAAYEDCVRRCTPEEVQAFLDRARAYWSGNNEMTQLVDSLQHQ